MGSSTFGVGPRRQPRAPGRGGPGILGARCAIRMTRKARPAAALSFGPAGRGRSKPDAGHTKAPEGTDGDLRSTGPEATNKSAVSGRRLVPRSPALRPANLVPGTVPRIAPRTGLAVQSAPSGKTKCTVGAMSPQRACPRTCGQGPKSYPRTWSQCGRSVDTLVREVSHGSSDRPPHRRTGSMGNATRGFQPSLAERPLPTDPATEGLPQRRLARAPAPRGRHGHPDRDAPAGRHPRPVEPAGGRRRRPGRDDPVHARRCRDRAADYVDTEARRASARPSIRP